ncbi:MAG TPA: carbohydrate-binding protein, partial [Puia sp.]|nr:carbohydrate-binding protein [Puia sp.]
SAGNRGWSYRNDGVDIQVGGPQPQTHPGQQLDYHVFNIEDGEWLQYTVDVTDGGKYTVSLTIAAADSGGKISLLCNNKPIASNISVPATGGLSNWQTIELKNSSLPKGTNQLRIVAEKGGFNFSQMRFGK